MTKTHHRTDLECLFDVTQMVSLYYLEFHQNYHAASHSFDFWQVNLVVKGARDMSVDNKTYHLEAGQMFFIAPDTSRQIFDAYGFNDVVVCSFVCQSPAMNIFTNKIITLTESETDLFLKFIYYGIPLFEKVDNEVAYGHIPRPETSVGALHQLKIYLELFLLLVYNRLTGDVQTQTNIFNICLNSNYSKLVSDIKNYFADHINENITLENLSAVFNLSVSSIKKIFKQITHQSVMKYFLNMKIEKAKSMILDDTMTISEISEILGFNSPTYFSTAFRKITNETPSSYLKRNKDLSYQSNHAFVKS